MRFKNAQITTASAAEVSVADSLWATGYEVVNRGWPDFIAIRGDTIRLIEVKKDSKDKPTDAQRRTHAILKRLGIVVEVLTPEEAARVANEEWQAYSETFVGMSA